MTTTPAEQIREIRKRTGMTQAEFSAEFEIPRRTIENWESGTTTPPQYVVKLLAYRIENEQKRGGQ